MVSFTIVYFMITIAIQSEPRIPQGASAMINGMTITFSNFVFLTFLQ